MNIEIIKIVKDFNSLSKDERSVRLAVIEKQTAHPDIKVEYILNEIFTNPVNIANLKMTEVEQAAKQLTVD